MGMYMLTEKKIHALLKEVDIKKNCKNIKEYERGKQAIGEWVWRNPDALSNNVQRIIADYVGV